ncbi:MAG: Uncharacterised protein [Candidatus Nitrosopelagicus brevis]|jgi:hypothetical protein|nr:MAG: Uncharacterised protein [Candidatus Nitrosopelagicus brevis]
METKFLPQIRFPKDRVLELARLNKMSFNSELGKLES